jgi:hypothetical protein
MRFAKLKQTDILFALILETCFLTLRYITTYGEIKICVVIF